MFSFSSISFNNYVMGQMCPFRRLRVNNYLRKIKIKKFHKEEKEKKDCDDIMILILGRATKII